jgi:hypothetical protein
MNNSVCDIIFNNKGYIVGLTQKHSQTRYLLYALCDSVVPSLIAAA